MDLACVVGPFGCRGRRLRDEASRLYVVRFVVERNSNMDGLATDDATTFIATIAATTFSKLTPVDAVVGVLVCNRK